MSGFVICARCGARIRADRGRCLRCGEILEAATPAPPTIREWFDGSRPRALVALLAMSVMLLAALAALVESRWQTREERARPAAATGRVTTAPPNGSSTASRDAAERLSTPATASDSMRLGSAAFDAGDLDGAKDRFEEALRRHASDPDALNGVGLVLERQGQLDDAIARFEKAAAILPGKWSFHFNLAHALAEKADWDRAISEYRTASSLFPNDYVTQYNLALTLHKKGNDEAAIPEFSRAIALAPGEPSFHLSLGISLEKTGKSAEAVREYRQYLEMAPGAPDAAEIKARIQSLGASTP